MAALGEAGCPAQCLSARDSITVAWLEKGLEQTCRNELGPSSLLLQTLSTCDRHPGHSKPGRPAGERLGTSTGRTGLVPRQEGVDPRCHSPETHGIYQGFLLPG